MNDRRYRRVVVFRGDLLSISETFIKEQTLALSRWRPILAGFRRVDGLELSGLDCRLLSAWGPERFSQRAIRVFRQFGGYPPGLRRQFKQCLGSLIHVHFATELVAVWPALRGLGVPILATLHGFDINIQKEFWQQLGRAHRLYPQRLLAAARHPRVHFVAVSEAMRKGAIEYGIPANKISVKYIGVDVTRFTPSGRPLSERNRRVLYVGRMVEKKGAGILIRAFAHVRDRLPDAQLTIVGDGPLLAENQQLAQRLNIPVIFRGSMSPDAIREEMREARVFCAPSITAANGDAEGFGIVILEALASGVPVVSSARGGAVEGINHGITGWCFPEHDIEALVAHLLRALTDDALICRMGRAARADMEARFDLRKCTAALEDLYDQLTVQGAARCLSETVVLPSREGGI